MFWKIQMHILTTVIQRIALVSFTIVNNDQISRTTLASMIMMIMMRVRCKLDKFAGDRMWCSLNPFAWLTLGMLIVALRLSKTRQKLMIC